MEQDDLLKNDLVISGISQVNLQSTAKWGKFLAIVGFVSCGLMVVAGIAMQTYISTTRIGAYNSSTKFLWLFYIIFAIISFFPCLYLFKFSKDMQEALRASDEGTIDSAFLNLKSLFKFTGIVTVVILAIYALIIIFTIISSVSR